MLDRIAIILIDVLKKHPPLAGEKIFMGPPSGEDGIFLDLTEFKIEHFGIGKTSFTKKDEIREFLSGDGEKRIFKLKYRPVKPVKRVEHPIGSTLTEKKDFKVNYNEGTVVFDKPPERGDKNILIVYYSSEASREIDLYKLKAIYTLYVAYKDSKKSLNMIYKVLEAILSHIEDFEEEGLEVRILPGRDIERAKIIPVEVEATMKVEKRVPVIEEIFIKGEKKG